ncbi:MAG: nucleotidyltransferase substrate binding protein [Deltaproteobacteria bacterium]|nr:nucleotidyltransferase substrate binding protein [Deltaproteobacteria bacterium]
MSTAEFAKALDRLKDALKQPKNDFIRDSVIQRFEFTVELAWKTAKKILLSSSNSPRSIIREMAQEDLITSPQIWFALIEARNLSSHTYKEELAEKVYQTAQDSIAEFEKLLEKLNA